MSEASVKNEIASHHARVCTAWRQNSCRDNLIALAVSFAQLADADGIREDEVKYRLINYARKADLPEDDVEAAWRAFQEWKPSLDDPTIQCVPPPTVEKKDLIERLLFIVNGSTPGDDLNAKVLKELIKDDLRFNSDRGVWELWDGKRWRQDVEKAVLARAREIPPLLYQVASRLPWEKRDPIGRHTLKTDSLPRLKAAVELAACDPALIVREADLDANPYHFNLKNGVFNLETRELLPHDPGFYITQLANVEYDPLAKALLWEKFLEEIFPDPAVREYFQMVIGLCLTGDMREQKFWVAYGGGENGKSTAIETIVFMFGDYAIEIDIDILMESGKPSDGNTATPGLARLPGKRFVNAPENKKNQPLKQGLIKKITGGESLICRDVYQRLFSFYPSCKIIIPTNHKPRVPDGGVSMWRRLRLLPFTVRIQKAKQDKALKDKLIAELPGIFNWALDGWDLYRAAGGLPEPAAVQTATDEYEASQDTFGLFLSETYQTAIVEYQQIPAGDAFKRYTSWCSENGERYVMSNKDFKIAMEEHHWTHRHRKNGAFYIKNDNGIDQGGDG